MSQSSPTPRPDPLLDAYRQASARAGGQAGAQVRAAVMAHARVVAQSMPSTTHKVLGVSEATRATSAANDHKPLWRLAAGLMLGLVGVWIFQLTRPLAAPDTAVATASSAQRDPAPVAETAAATPAATVVSPAAPVVATVAPTMSPPAPSVAARPPAPEASLARARGDTATASASQPLRPLESARRETAVGTAATAASGGPTVNAARPGAAPLTADRVAAAPVVAGPSAADAALAAVGGDPAREIVIAAVELRKSARANLRDEPATPVSAAPDAFPATASEPMIALAAPAAAPRAPVPTTAGSAAPARGSASGERSTRASVEPADALASRPQAAAKVNEALPSRALSEPDQTLLSAVRTGDIAALRAAIARGANVNAKDERGRTMLQIARERNDVDMIRALEAARAR